MKTVINDSEVRPPGSTGFAGPCRAGKHLFGGGQSRPLGSARFRRVPPGRGQFVRNPELMTKSELCAMVSFTS
eukprot:126150-Alexandrium_andersonii.AAC.1